MNPGKRMHSEAAAVRVRRVIERLFSDGSAIARSDGTVHSLFPVAITEAEGDALRDRVMLEGANRTIEIGLGYGLSALFICEALAASGNIEAHHVAVDPHQAARFSDCGLQFLDEAEVTKLVEYHAPESHVVLPNLLSDGRSFDLPFVDGNHRFDGVFVDLVYLGRLVRREVLCFWTITSCRRLHGRRPFSSRISAGRSRRHRLLTPYISGPFSGRPRCQTRDPSTITSFLSR